MLACSAEPAPYGRAAREVARQPSRARRWIGPQPGPQLDWGDRREQATPQPGRGHHRMRAKPARAGPRPGWDRRRARAQPGRTAPQPARDHRRAKGRPGRTGLRSEWDRRREGARAAWAGPRPGWDRRREGARPARTGMCSALRLGRGRRPVRARPAWVGARPARAALGLERGHRREGVRTDPWPGLRPGRGRLGVLPARCGCGGGAGWLLAVWRRRQSWARVRMVAGRLGRAVG